VQKHDAHPMDLSHLRW